MSRKFWQFKNQAGAAPELLLYGDIADSTWWGDEATPKQFKEDLDADSLDLVEVVLALEEKFGIEIPDDEIAGVKTVGEAADLVISKQTAVG